MTRAYRDCRDRYRAMARTLGFETRVTDEMMRVAAATLGEASPALADSDQPLLPAWSDVPDVAARIAHAAAVQALADGVAPKRAHEDLTARIARVRWAPEYPATPDCGLCGSSVTPRHGSRLVRRHD